ncbi:protein of unknown function [Candidatus Methylomirabilis oxygeniifera]|uniref:Uncharacterized protein n=1 Tax=Methylomirabilis oxygeniifera TaxID=671143 RepID=D5MMT7_METO1|nr:protein of unknown function [Candidatus Methylomirabilis oxyfera]
MTYDATYKSNGGANDRTSSVAPIPNLTI